MSNPFTEPQLLIFSKKQAEIVKETDEISGKIPQRCFYRMRDGKIVEVTQVDSNIDYQSNFDDAVYLGFGVFSHLEDY